MSYHILYQSSPWHSRAALFDDNGRLLTLRFDDFHRRYISGAVAWGRVRKVEVGLGGAFVDIGARVDGFLPFSTLPPEMKKNSSKANAEKGGLVEGQNILVRIARGGFDEKGPKLDGRVAAKAPPADTPAPALVHPAPSCLQRALHDAGANPVLCWIPDGRLRDHARKYVAEANIRQLDDDDADWVERVEAEVDRMLSPKPTWPLGLNGSGSIIVEMTSAVATIDVNATPQAMGAKAEAMLASNLMAAGEVARLCRLLDLGGSVIADFVTPDVQAHRQMISDHLSATCSTTDDNFVELRPMSRHGLVELNRARTGPSLMLLLRSPSFVAGRILLELWRAAPGTLPNVRQRVVHCHPDVASLLVQYLSTEVCLRELGMPVRVEADATRGVVEFSIRD